MRNNIITRANSVMKTEILLKSMQGVSNPKLNKEGSELTRKKRA